MKLSEAMQKYGDITMEEMMHNQRERMKEPMWFKPEEDGELFYFLGRDGTIHHDDISEIKGGDNPVLQRDIDNMQKIGNLYKTNADAELGRMRLYAMSLNGDWRPEYGEYYYFWSFTEKEPLIELFNTSYDTKMEIKHSEGYLSGVYLGNCFPYTERGLKLCEKFGDYEHAFTGKANQKEIAFRDTLLSF